jgi:hypothetical protein
MLGERAVGVTSCSGEGVGAQVPVGVARATCVWVLNDQPASYPQKWLPASPFYRRKGEGQNGDTNMRYSATVLGGLFPCRCPSGSEGR